MSRGSVQRVAGVSQFEHSMKSAGNYRADSVETVEAIKSLLNRQSVGDVLEEALASALSENSAALTRRLNGEPLFISVARHCSEFNEVRSMEILAQAFLKCRELARMTPILKAYLLSNIVNTAAIAGLFKLHLSDPEVSKIVHMATLRNIIPGSWSEQGLVHSKWAELCRSAAQNDSQGTMEPEFKHKVALRSAPNDAHLDSSLDLQALQTKGHDWDKHTPSMIQSIGKLVPLPPIEPDEWLKMLVNEDYNIRSAAAELVGIYVASGRRQYATIKMLMGTARKHVAWETYLRAISSACIALSRKSTEQPAKFPEESFTQRSDIVLRLTQQQRQPQLPSQPAASGNSVDNGVWSYLNNFNGLFVLYSALVEALREEEPVALMAAHHFQVISESLDRTPWQLCQPYWPWLAPKIVLPYDQAFVDWVCSNALQVSREDFLLRTASFTIPHLCLVGKPQTKACDEIASFRGCSVRRLYIDNTAAIIALLLMGSPFEDPEEAWEYAEVKFMALDRSFRALEFNKIVSTWRVELIYEVLMHSTNEKASLAIGMVNKIMEKSYDRHAGEHKELLQQTLFKLVVKFSDTMRNLMGRQSQTTKLSALTGLKFLIERFLSPALVASVLRQLTAFLQAALENSQLSYTALQTWLAVVQKLSVNKMELIVDLTYSIINERIDMWDRDAVKCAEDIVKQIRRRLRELPFKDVKIHPQSIFDRKLSEAEDASGNSSPSEQALEHTSQGYTGHACYDILLSLIERDTENTYLAQQTARDICAFSLEYQSVILAWAQTDGPGHALLGQAVRVLLNLCSKNDMDLRKMSARALGLLGALDPHTTGISSQESTLIIVHNFQNAAEVINFSRVLVQDWFLPAFEAAIDPTVQRYVAYGIQELLKFMGVEEENKLKTLFKDDSLVSTLLPLVKTKYTTDMKHWNSPMYPIYSTTISYSDWLIIFCSDMMDRTSDPEYATRIFTWCRKVLYGSSAGPEMWAYLFPYAALASVVDYHDGEANREAFLSEVLLVLEVPGEHVQPFHERIFAVFDYFNQWMRSRRQLKQPLLGMDTLLARIPARLMAQRALDSGAYPRAIRYYEQQIREEGTSDSDILEKLRHMYASMQDVDSLEGISARMPTLSVEQQVLEYRATSQWDAALACYNALPVNEATFVASLECLQRSGREHEVLAELATESIPLDLAPLGAECAWVVRDWRALDKWTALIDAEQVGGASSQLPPGSIQALGHALLSLHDKDWEGFKNALDVGRKYVGYKLGDVVSTHHITSLRQIRELMVYLHGLADIESLGAIVMPDQIDSDFLLDSSTAQLVKEQLDARLAVLSPLSEGPEFHARRFLLTLRAATLSCIEAQFPQATGLIAEAHLAVSAAARHHGQPSIALMEIAAAKQLNNSKADIEHAHLLWAQGESRSAIRMLQSKLPTAFFQKPRSYPEFAPHALDWTTWRDNAAQADTKAIVDNYNAVIKAMPESAEAQYRLAKHYVKIYHQSPLSVRNDGTLSKLIVHHFCRALELGTTRANEALPKMLTTWFDLGIMPDDLTPQEASSRKHCLSQSNKEVQSWGKIIDKRLIYTAIPQLLSRHNHTNKTIRGLVEQLIILVLQRYPHHTLWPVLEKGENVRGLIGEATNKMVKTEQAEFANLISTGSQIVEKLKRICALKPKPKETKLAELGEDFTASLMQPSLAVPVQSAMDGLEPILIYQIEERVVVQQSLQRPKRIVVWGTDGRQYQLLLKGNDDVRKDSRLIEFTTAVNQLLRSDAAAASRHLDILTYRVTPLGASAGIIEWVNGAVPVRSIMYSLSRNPKLGFGSPEVKKMTNTAARIGERLSAFHALERAVPPVLWEWFVDTFPDPEAWLEARTRYARTLAVMSMIGYLLGLGDRHLENILLLQSSGAVLHVDFDCLFDKGRHLAVPELVPFRLTQQFRDALGIVNDYEGPFRKVSELTLKIVRSNEDLLMVVLEAFIHDPVVQDRINIMQPRQTMERLSAKIRGIREPNSVPLSVGGLVDELIQVAVSPENLCQLFKGWMPWV